MLLVGEEREQRVRHGAEEVIDEADDLGKIGATHGGGDVGGELFEGSDLLGVGGVVAADRGGEVLIAEMEDGEADLLASPR